MKLLLTGGGTGGHIYPALEVGRSARACGAELVYFGSVRGQESQACIQADVTFRGFLSEPLYSLRSARGWRSAIRLLRATGAAKRALREERPDVVFSTGGYSAAPVMAAAKSLGIPFGIHEANSVPGRSNRLFANRASFLTCSFKTTAEFLPGVTRTGHPIRAELRAMAQSPEIKVKNQVLALGGSQGSVFLNDLVVGAAECDPLAKYLLATGRTHFDPTMARANLRVVEFFDAAEIAEVYRSSVLFLGRSGGTLAEVAMFGLPSILIPLPTSADDHQLRNAQEFEAMGAAIILPQANASPEMLVREVSAWIADKDKRAHAAAMLKEWDRPDATDQIVEKVFGAVSSK